MKEMKTMKRSLAAVLALALVAVASAELHTKTLLVEDVSQTYLFPTMADGVTLCNYGADVAYYRLFWDGEIPSAATASSASHQLPVGTATAPYCVGIPRPQTTQAPWRAISIICGTGETATVTVEPL